MCVYLGERQDDRSNTCLRHGKCSTNGEVPGLLSCLVCADNLALDDPKFSSKWADPLVILDRRRNCTDALRGVLGGIPVFLAGGGPSANDHELQWLNHRGVFTLCINNMAGHPKFRPQAFVCSDPPSKFSHSIWLDPQVMKFVPTPKMGGRRAALRIKQDGKFGPLDRTVPDCPNVWGFKRNSWLTPDDQFFLCDGACWGNHNAGVEMTGQPKTVCTMLLGLRILKHLGAGRVYLIGVDFFMEPDRVYSFAQDKHNGGCQSNNGQFAVVNGWLCEMQAGGVFDRFGMEVFNCYERSGLRAFPYVSFHDAYLDVVGRVETIPDLIDWYAK